MNSNVELFEAAARQKLRFETNRGQVSYEDLWDMALTHPSGLDLDTVAKTVNRKLKAIEEESFVNVGKNPQADLLALQLAIVKRVIAVIQQEKQEAEARAGRRAERGRLLEILESKQQEKMMGMSVKQIQARIAELEV